MTVPEALLQELEAQLWQGPLADPLAPLPNDLAWPAQIMAHGAAGG